MALDRSIRSLTSLTAASTSRVLNLAAIAAANADNPAHKAAPFFTSAAMNVSILLKHRVRSDETYMFAGERLVATKIIVPFDARNLKAGGRSFFVGQRGYHDSLLQMGHYAGRSMERDLAVLGIVDALPSLDPFLLREHLRAGGHDCADREQMHAHVAAQIRNLIELATGDDSREATARLVTALLSNQIDEKLEPLRQTLMLEAEDFREGVFSWRGFLYYKWSMEKLWPQVVEVLRAVRAMHPTGAIDRDAKAFLSTSRDGIVERVRDAGQSVQKILSVYDAAYADLVRNGTPNTFRDFLLSAPHLFLDLGEKMGVISHIVSFWRFRFPQTDGRSVDAEELSAIFRDFNTGFTPSQVFV